LLPSKTLIRNVNPNLSRLQPYPFEKLRQLFKGVAPNTRFPEIKLFIGEPQHETPLFIKEAFAAGLGGLANYPTTLGGADLRRSIAAWIERRYGFPRLAGIDADTQIIPVNGSREALFSFCQAVIDPGAARGGPPIVVCPNPFYQIYEGAAFLAGAEPRFLNTLPEDGFAFDFDTLSDAEWQRVQIFYVCSPGNPTGKVLQLDDWRRLFELADRYGFIIAADECYSEIYFDEDAPPLGGLQAARLLGRGWDRLVMFSSLSKRSNAPGLRSGFVAGDAAILKAFLLYRTYHGCAMSPAVQTASTAAWQDEAHVRNNRHRYREKFDVVTPILNQAMGAVRPDASFYYWARTPIDDGDFARRLLAEYNVMVLPGSFLARESGGVNPGAGFVRIALVAPLAECVDAAERIRSFTSTLQE
jgi:N-succinyldiaminopimelate aminotransferase